MDVLPDDSSTFWKVGRVKTFEFWPFQSSTGSCNPERMAAAGFYAVGGESEPDLVQCFICSKQLDGWEPDDDPWTEHHKHESSCAFIKMNKPEETSWTVDELFCLFKKYMVITCTDELKKQMIIAEENRTKLAKNIPLIYRGLRKDRKDIS